MYKRIKKLLNLVNACCHSVYNLSFPVSHVNETIKYTNYKYNSFSVDISSQGKIIKFSLEQAMKAQKVVEV
jgi:hypothetical protein